MCIILSLILEISILQTQTYIDRLIFIGMNKEKISDSFYSQIKDNVKIYY